MEKLSQDYLINIPEVHAASEAVRELARERNNFRIHCDNKTACDYKAKQGGKKSRRLNIETLNQKQITSQETWR